MVFGVEDELLSTVHAEAKASFAGLTFISNHEIGNTREPLYFDNFASIATESVESNTNLAARITAEVNEKLMKCYG